MRARFRREFREAWPPPAIPGVDDPRHRRFVLLAWALGEIEASRVGSTSAVFERIARSTRLVTYTSGRLRPQGERAASPRLTLLRLTSIARMPRAGAEGDLVVLRSPAELVHTLSNEVGLPRGVKGGGRVR